jgi:hypothetical protein
VEKEWIGTVSCCSLIARLIVVFVMRISISFAYRKADSKISTADIVPANIYARSVFWSHLGGGMNAGCQSSAVCMSNQKD